MDVTDVLFSFTKTHLIASDLSDEIETPFNIFLVLVDFVLGTVAKYIVRRPKVTWEQGTGQEKDE